MSRWWDRFFSTKTHPSLWKEKHREAYKTMTSAQKVVFFNVMEKYEALKEADCNYYERERQFVYLQEKLIHAHIKQIELQGAFRVMRQERDKLQAWKDGRNAALKERSE